MIIFKVTEVVCVTTLVRTLLKDEITHRHRHVQHFLQLLHLLYTGTQIFFFLFSGHQLIYYLPTTTITTITTDITNANIDNDISTANNNNVSDVDKIYRCYSAEMTQNNTRLAVTVRFVQAQL